jgi:hypothetical protein
MIKSIKKGNKNWRPWGIPWPLFLPWVKGIAYKVSFDRSCWYNWEPDRDQDDINKGGGFTKFYSRNNSSSYMWGWNPLAQEEGIFRIFAYYNDEERKFKFEHLANVKAGEDFYVQVLTSGKIVILTDEIVQEHQFKAPDFKWARMISEWFGGEDNSPGPHGGVAPHDMEKTIKRKILL